MTINTKTKNISTYYSRELHVDTVPSKISLFCLKYYSIDVYEDDPHQEMGKKIKGRERERRRIRRMRYRYNIMYINNGFVTQTYSYSPS